MPYLMIQTNQTIDATAGKSLLRKASKLLAAELGKPESYAMVALEADVPMLFGGEDSPLAYLELKSIGLPQEKTARLSTALCSLLEESVGINKKRVYIEFANAEKHMWGWDGGTF